jgi:hypothetical protein
MDRPAQGQGPRCSDAATTVRAGTDDKDRFATCPATLTPWLQSRLARVKTWPQQALAQGHGEGYLPHALTRKYPHTARAWGW